MGLADLPVVPAAVIFCRVALVGSLGVGSGFLVPLFGSRWYRGILCPVPTLALLPFVLSFSQIWEPDLQLVWVRGWFMLSEGSEGLRSQFLVCKINWTDLNDVLWDDFGEPCIRHRGTYPAATSAGAACAACRPAAPAMQRWGSGDGRKNCKKQHLLGAGTACSYRSWWGWVLRSAQSFSFWSSTPGYESGFSRNKQFFAFILKLNDLLLNYVIAA